MASLDNDNILGNTIDNKITTSFKGCRVVRSVDLEAWTTDNKKEQKDAVPLSKHSIVRPPWTTDCLCVCQ